MKCSRCLPSSFSWTSLLFSAICILCASGTAWSGTYTAKTCNSSDVNAVINGPTHTATSGDVIIIPSGTCTWTSGINISGVGIDITGTGTPNTGAGTMGAGTANTTLTLTFSGPFFNFTNLSYGQTAMLELLSLSAGNMGADSVSSAANFSGKCTTSGCANIRVDNITFVGGVWAQSVTGGLTEVDNVFGVVDHNTDTADSLSANIPLIQVNYDAWQGVGAFGDNSFATPDTFGTGQAMYIENNLMSTIRLSENDVSPLGFNQTGGARYVCRFNTVTNMSGTGFCSAHGTAWSGRPRGQRQVEAYYNSVTLGPGQACNSINGLNSGSGYYFSNTVNIVSGTGGGCNMFLMLDIARLTGTAAPWGHCDGTQPWDQSPWSSSSACLDQPGSGVSTSLESALPTFLSGASCSKSGQCWPNPVPDPVYEAGEVMATGGFGGSAVGVEGDGSTSRLKANVDYYAEVSQNAQTSKTSPFNGTMGTGYGTLSNMPSTCTNGVGYWATDQGTWNATGNNEGQLYVCKSGAWTLKYTPYAYPHPLTVGGAAATPQPPPPTNINGNSLSPS